MKKFNFTKVWILPNNDAGSNSLRRTLFNLRDADIYIHDNLSRIDYLSLLKYTKAIIGNSSSGLLEAPTFKTPAINIGRRQFDRLQGLNVINCQYEKDDIVLAIKQGLSHEFSNKLSNCVNPYGDGRSSKKIIDVLKNTSIDDKLLVKRLTL